jgi:long-chain acyl-CoA synthetase
MRCADF